MLFIDKEEYEFEKKLEEESFSLVGTAEYVSPEVLEKKTENLSAIDLWALGCIIYYFFHGQTPFKDNNEFLTLENVLKKSLTNISENIPESAKDLIQKLLIRNPNERLGARSFDDFENLKKHTFFNGIDFANLHIQDPPLEVDDYFKSPIRIRKTISHANLLKPEIKIWSTNTNDDEINIINDYMCLTTLISDKNITKSPVSKNNQIKKDVLVLECKSFFI